MIKDVVVSLSVGKPRDVAGDFAISVATAFRARLSGVAFAYQPVIGGMLLPVTDASVLEAFHAENHRAADRAKRDFDEATRRAGVASDSIAIAATPDEAARRFGEIARDYDLSVVAQAEPDGDVSETLAIEAALFESGGPGRRWWCPLYPVDRAQARPRDGLLGRQPQRGARRRGRDAAAATRRRRGGGHHRKPGAPQ